MKVVAYLLCCAICSSLGQRNFKCRDGNWAIPISWQCDGYGDCMDNSDEENCFNALKNSVEETLTPCNSLIEFSCENGFRQCVPMENVCDKINDCGDGSDEIDCPTTNLLSQTEVVENATSPIPSTASPVFSSSSAQSSTSSSSITNPPFTSSSSDFAFLPNVNLPCPFGLKRPHSMCLTPIRLLFDRFEQVDKSEVLSRHNHWRRQVVPKPRQPLPDLQWDDDLARTAAGWAAQCRMGSDDSTNRALPDRGGNKTAWQIGQNICLSQTSSTKTLTECIDEWAAERQNWAHGIGRIGDGAVKHYTQIIWEETLFIGCAISLCKFTNIQQRVICNYGPAGNVGPDGLPTFAIPYAAI